MNDVYSPDTGEHIQTDTPSDWMEHAGVDVPAYRPSTQSAFWRSGAWVIVTGTVGPTATELWTEYQQKAQALLDFGDKVAIRCLKAGVPYTAPWLARDVALRAIVVATSGDPTQPLPAQPATYPAGS